MFAGFKLQIDEHYFNNSNLEFESLYNKEKAEIREGLEAYICGKGYINGTLLEESWFPKIDADIFISHSHQDESLAIKFGGWLWRNFKIKAFIDSCVWGHADKLMYNLNENLADKRIANGETVYDYGKGNRNSSHVHMMLSSALTKMIDSTECLIFLNTPHALDYNEYLDSNCTQSPWIYSELLLSNLVRKTEPDRLKKDKEYRNKFAFEHATEPVLIYKEPENSLVEIDGRDLTEWVHNRDKREHALDVLYELNLEMKGFLNE